jgi:hypothetical protein
VTSSRLTARSQSMCRLCRLRRIVSQARHATRCCAALTAPAAYQVVQSVIVAQLGADASHRVTKDVLWTCSARCRVVRTRFPKEVGLPSSIDDGDVSRVRTDITAVRWCRRCVTMPGLRRAYGVQMVCDATHTCLNLRSNAIAWLTPG